MHFLMVLTRLVEILQMQECGRGAEKGLKGLFKGGGKLIGGLGKAAMGALRFAAPVGLIATAAMTIFDGVLWQE